MIVKFEESQFNRIFPFYILINPDLLVESNGQTLEKIFPGTSKRPFFDNFRIKRPELLTADFQSLSSLTNQMLVME
ncbi:MAG TPA: hypothetical protein VLA03_00130, partial [Draconibacterium sp.]|nr:hypothetical protein [Draconibacterium sp.]